MQFINRCEELEVLIFQRLNQKRNVLIIAQLLTSDWTNSAGRSRISMVECAEFAMHFNLKDKSDNMSSDFLSN